MESAISEDFITLDPTGEKRRDYIERKDFIENFLLKNPPKKDYIELENGAKTLVLSTFTEMPPELRRENSTYNLAVYVPGLFQADKGNYGNHPVDVKLAGGLLTGDIDAVMVLKAEALNDEAHLKPNGEGAVQEIVSRAAFQILKQNLDKLGPEKPVVVNMFAVSEGVTQSVSIAMRIEESSIAKVKECVLVGASGLIGADKQQDANPVKFVARAISRLSLAPKIDKRVKKESEDTYYVDKRVVGDKVQGGLEESLGRARVSALDDTRNIAFWVGRLNKILGSSVTGIQPMIEGLLSSPNYPKEAIPELENFIADLAEVRGFVPWERIKAVTTKNPDYKALAKRGIPIVIFSGHDEIFYPNIDIREEVKKLREIPNSKVVLINSNVGHSFPHINPSGTAYIIELIKKKAGL